jgi:hypothetical protein
MSNRILVPVVLLVVGATAWLCLDRGPLSLHADSARPARLGVAAALAGQTAPAGPFRMKTVTNGANWQAYRYNASTGETMQMVNLKDRRPTVAPANEGFVVVQPQVISPRAVVELDILRIAGAFDERVLGLPRLLGPDPRSLQETAVVGPAVPLDRLRGGARGKAKQEGSHQGKRHCERIGFAASVNHDRSIFSSTRCRCNPCRAPASAKLSST